MPTDVTTALDLSTHHLWVTLSILSVGVLVRLLKSEKIPAPLNRIPPKARPVVALALGQVSGILEQLLVPGVSWRATIVGGLISGVSAVAGHDIFIEWLAGGKEPLQTKPPVQVAPADRVPVNAPLDRPSTDVTGPVTIDPELLAAARAEAEAERKNVTKKE